MDGSSDAAPRLASASSDVSFNEPIRCIIWDLDETFWSGTITEGGIAYNQQNHDLVIRLAEQGIISSICSTNEHAVVEAELTNRGIWDYFVFPSVDWSPKGQRLKATIEAIGLRPATVLFIDDNWQNLYQAADLIPGLNVAEPSIIPSLGSHPQLATKDDRELTRLKQYRNAQAKRDSVGSFGGNQTDFLRQSDIRVYFEYNVEKHIDRVIELINRTNQLNFTKERLPEDPEEAKGALLSFLRHNGTTPGLVRVVDRYGDYGFVGFYAMTDLARVYTLRHFCFSCRTINMYIEHFVYDFIGRPNLTVVGEVLSDIKSPDVPKVDWVTALPIEQLAIGGAHTSLRFPTIYARGGCDLMALMHYFSLNSDHIIQEFNTLKNWQPLRLDHSAFLKASLAGMTDDQRRAAAALGFDNEDFRTAFPTSTEDADLVLLSFWADADIPFYRHRATGLELPYWMIGTAKENYITDDEALNKHSNPLIRDRVVNHLRKEWDYVPVLTHGEMVARYRSFIQSISPRTPIVMTLANDRDHAYFYSPLPLSVDIGKRAYNMAVIEASHEFDNVILVDFRKYVAGPDDILDMNHLRRSLYVDIYHEIVHAVRGFHARSDAEIAATA